MIFNSLDEVRYHLIGEAGYKQAEVVQWLTQFTDERQVAALLANPTVVIRDFPITNEEAMIRQGRLSDEATVLADEVWDD